MKLHDHIHRIICALIALGLIVLADLATAQDWIGQFPFAPPMASPIVRGRFYFQGGVRYRNIQKLEFSQQSYQTQSGDPGVPPFGPNVAGDFGTGTGRPGFPTSPDFAAPGFLDPDTSGVWYYNNGSVDARPRRSWSTTCTNDSTEENCINNPQAWPQAPRVGLGRFVTIGSETCDAPPCPCCATVTLPDNTGSFIIADPTSQVNNLESISGTIRVTWQRIIDGTYNADVRTYTPEPVPADPAAWDSGEVASAFFTYGNENWKEPLKSHQIWSPNFEVGFQYSNLFDLFYGFSWFDLSRTFAKSFPLSAGFSRRGFQDTFSFFSDQTGTGWPAGSFDSAGTIIGTSATFNYQIWPDGIGQGLYPHREFFIAADASVPDAAFQETIAHRTEISVIENRWGARSWFPLFGMGRMGMYLGFILSPIYHKESGSRVVININDVANPAPPPALLLAAGQVIEAQAATWHDWWFNFGGFLGTDLELDYRGYYVKGSADYAICIDQSYNLLGVETRFNPGGFSAAISGGFHF